LVELFIEGGVGAIPWNMIVWAVPGSSAHSSETRLKGKVSEKATRRFFAGLFSCHWAGIPSRLHHFRPPLRMSGIGASHVRQAEPSHQ
jgi:hypothetical protein